MKANEATYSELTGSPVGFAGPVNSKAQFLTDFDVSKVTDGVAGANEVDTHLIHVVPGRDFDTVRLCGFAQSTAAGGSMSRAM